MLMQEKKILKMKSDYNIAAEMQRNLTTSKAKEECVAEAMVVLNKIAEVMENMELYSGAEAVVQVMESIPTTLRS